MKILHILNDVYEGGVRSLLANMAKYQIEKGNEVDVLCIISNPNYFKNIEEFKQIGINIIKGKYKNPYNPLNIFFIKKYIKNHDILHIHHFPNQLYAKIAYILIPPKKRPIFITTEHSTFNNRRNYHILKYIDRWFYRSYDSIVGISNAATNNLINWIKSSKIKRKVLTITNGIDINKFQNAENKTDQILQLTHDSTRRYVVMVSRMEYPKDPMTLLRSALYYPNNTHLIFVGSGNLCKEISEEAHRLNIAERVHILGNRSDIPEILKGCDVGVLSTKWEGFGLVAAEYMAAGLPITVTDVDGLREVVNDKDALFPYKDAVLLGKRINKLLSDSKYYQNKVQHSINQSKKFSVQIMNEKYLNLYTLLYEQNKNSRKKLNC